MCPCWCSKVIKRIFYGVILGFGLTIGGVVLLSMRAGLGAGYIFDSKKQLMKVLLLRRFGPKSIATSTLIGTYLKLTTKALFTQQDAIHCEHILGYNVHFYDYVDFRYLFAEVFGNEEYYFTAKTKNPFIIDCGANIGMATLYFKMLYPDAQILAFEPSRLCFDVLQKNITTNNLSTVTAINKALSNYKGKATLLDASCGKGNLCATMLFDKAEQRASYLMPIECDLLSTYITKPVDLLKLDIEGGERAVFEDLDRNGKFPLIKEMVLEYHHHIPAEREIDALGTFLATLERYNFGYQIMGCATQMGYQYELLGGQALIIHAYQKINK
ncbi:MAG: FkbM family methyltransferase [Candidatus Babeliales bacterium]|jgi:FkbM family methyltransferase